MVVDRKAESLHRVVAPHVALRNKDHSVAFGRPHAQREAWIAAVVDNRCGERDVCTVVTRLQQQRIVAPLCLLVIEVERVSE